jgi:hypothetical protein
MLQDKDFPAIKKTVLPGRFAGIATTPAQVNAMSVMQNLTTRILSEAVNETSQNEDEERREQARRFILIEHYLALSSNWYLCNAAKKIRNAISCAASWLYGIKHNFWSQDHCGNSTNITMDAGENPGTGSPKLFGSPSPGSSCCRFPLASGTVPGGAEESRVGHSPKHRSDASP